MKTVPLTIAAARQLDGLPEAARGQVTSALDHYTISGDGDVKKLAGREGYRLRVGRYRVLFDEDQVTLLAIYIGKRETTTYNRS